MRYHIIPDKDALKNCAWCGNNIEEFDDVFAADARLQPDVDFSEYQGHCIEIDLISQEKTLNVMVTAGDSAAKADGKDLMFLVCSEKCRQELNFALKKEAVSSKVFATP
jgi:hypothetical protein